MIPFEVPKGLATKLGLWGTFVLAVVSAVQPFLEGDHTGDMKFYSALATIVGVATTLGRMLQGAALLKDVPAPSQLGDDSGEPDEWDDPLAAEVAPAEHELHAKMPEDAPEYHKPSGSGKAGETP